MSTELLEKTPVKTGISKLSESFRDGAGYEKDGAGRLVPKNEEKGETLPTVEKTPVEKPLYKNTPEVKESAPELKQEPLNDGLAQGLKSVMAPKKAEPTKEDNIVNLRKIAEERQKRIEELEAKQQSLPPDYEELKKDRELLSNELAKVRVEATPEFKKKFVEPMSKREEDIKRALASVEVDAADFMAVLNSPESKERSQKLSDMVSGMGPFSEKLLMASVSDYANLKEQRDSELKSPTEAFAKYQEQEAAFKKQQVEQFNGVIDSVIESRQKAIPFLQKIEGNDKWNSQVDTILSNAKSAWKNPTSTEDQAEMVLAAQMAPFLYHGIQAAYAELEKANAELAQYNKATPDTRANNGHKAEGGSSSGEKKSIGAIFREGAGSS